MQCVEFESRLHRLLDHRRAPDHDPRLVAHSRRCRRCQQTLNLQRQMIAALELPPLEDPSVELAQRVVDQASRRQQPARRGRFRALLAIAALLVVAAIPLWGIMEVPSDPARPRAVGPSAAPEPAATPEMLAAPPDAAPLDPTRPPSGWLAPLHEPGRPTDRPQLALGPHVPYAALGASAEQDPVPRMLAQINYHLSQVGVEPLDARGPVDQLSGGLRPVAESFTTALDVLRRTLPLGRSPRGEPQPAADAAAIASASPLA